MPRVSIDGIYALCPVNLPDKQPAKILRSIALWNSMETSSDEKLNVTSKKGKWFVIGTGKDIIGKWF